MMAAFFSTGERERERESFRHPRWQGLLQHWASLSFLRRYCCAADRDDAVDGVQSPWLYHTAELWCCWQHNGGVLLWP